MVFDCVALQHKRGHSVKFRVSPFGNGLLTLGVVLKNLKSIEADVQNGVAV